MQAPHYIIHVGPMKTASTYLQKCIGVARPALASQGIYFPTELTGPRFPTIHMQIMPALYKPELFEGTQKIFAALNTSGHPTILLSCEHLAKLNRPAMLRLRELIGSDNVTIVYMCRRWSDRVTSLCFQSAADGGTQALPDYYARLLNGENKTPELDYSHAWQNWAHAFGRDQIKIVPVSNIDDAKQDVFERFCTDILGMQQAPHVPQAGTKIWASGEAHEVELVRSLNALHQQNGGKKDATMYWGGKMLRRDHDLQELDAMMDASTQEFLLDDNAPVLNGMYKRLEAFLGQLSSQRDGAQMFTRKARRAKYVSPDYLLRDGAASLVRSLYVAVIAAGIKPPNAA